MKEKKHVIVHTNRFGQNSDEAERHYARFQVKQFKGILDKFYSEDGFMEYGEIGRISIAVGHDHTETDFNPVTWEAMEKLLMTYICHFIIEYSLECFQYYKNLLDECCEKLGVNPDDAGTTFCL